MASLAVPATMVLVLIMMSKTSPVHIMTRSILELILQSQAAFFTSVGKRSSSPNVAATREIIGRKRVLAARKKRPTIGWCRYRGAKQLIAATNAIKAPVSSIRLFTRGMFLALRRS